MMKLDTYQPPILKQLFIIGIVLVLALLLIPLAMSDVQVSKVNINSRYSVELISNTEQCFNCEAVYEICNLWPLPLTIGDLNFKFYDTKQQAYDYFKVGILESINNRNLKLSSINLQYERDIIVNIEEPVYGQCTSNQTYISNKTQEKITEFYNYTCITSYKQVATPSKEWVDFKSWELTSLDSKQCIKLKLSGSLGWKDATDHVFYIDNTEVKEFAWWNNSWGKCKNITITSSNTWASGLPVLLNVTHNSSKSDFSDLRFVNASCDNDGSEVGYWIENYVADTYADVWINTSLDSSGDTIFAMYYNNSDATSESNGAETFNVFDDCSGVSLNTTVWKNNTAINITCANGICTFHPSTMATYFHSIIETLKTFGKNYSFYANIRLNSTGSSGTPWQYGFAEVGCTNVEMSDCSGSIYGNMGFWTDTTILAEGGGLNLGRWSAGTGWFKTEVFRNNSEKIFYYGNNTNGLSYLGVATVALTTVFPAQIHYRSSGTADSEVDYMFVRKVVPLPITSGFGAEQTYSTNNNAPVMNTTRVSPTTPHINDTLIGYCNATDEDGNSLSYEYIWYDDGGEITLCGSTPCNGNTTNYTQGLEININNISFTNEQISYPRNITLACRANDSSNQSAWLNTTVQILNSPPTLDDVDLQPANPNSSTDLACSATMTDPEGFVSRAEYWWYNGTIFMLGGNETDIPSGISTAISILGSGNTSAGETWNCTIQAHDSYNGTSSGYDSEIVTINNTPPYLTIILNSTDPLTNYTTTNLTCNYNCSDYDGDDCDNYTAYKWFNDSGVIAGNTTSVFLSNYTHKNINYTCEVTIQDDSNYTNNQTVLNSSALRILNTPPLMTSVSVTTPLYEHLDAMCSPSGSDNDSDALIYYYRWFNDYGIISGETTNTLSQTLHNLGDNITCEATANDGTANSSALNSTPVIVVASTGLNITFRDEQTNELITTTTIYLEAVSNTSYAANQSTTTGIIYITNITSETYEIRYWGSGYDLRFYYLNITSANQNLTLYLLNSSESDAVSYVMTDTAGKPVQYAYLKILRRYISGSTATWNTIEMSKSDVNGEGIIYIELYDVPYRFLIEKNNVVLKNIDNEAVISRTTMYFKNIDILGTGLTGFWYSQGTATRLKWNNATNSFDFTYTGTASQILFARLEVMKKTSFAETVVCNETSTSVSGTLTCNLSAYVGQSGQFVATGLVDTNSTGSWYTVARETWEFITTARSMWGISGAFYSFLIILTLALMGLWNPNVTIFLAMAGIAVSFVIGTLPMTFPWVVGLIIVGIILIMQNKA